ncbi:Uncharacterised protein [Chromobacterium violaceum]|uniref:Uncharacterized protein n=1 Tax=Chromobacterium violaceum TaxID=536 RepID=A0A447T9L5_CHRVL|nr:Uncharacterised protein [Chromobacterium violaceum]
MVYKNANICQQLLNIPSWSKNSIENGCSLLILSKGIGLPADGLVGKSRKPGTAEWRGGRRAAAWADQSRGQGIDFGSGASASASGSLGAAGAATLSTSRHQGWARSAWAGSIA